MPRHDQISIDALERIYTRIFLRLPFTPRARDNEHRVSLLTRAIFTGVALEHSERDFSER